MRSPLDADEIHIVPPDSAWPALFTHEAGLIRAALPLDVEHVIEHFGSTAVPGLAAKPIIDILVVVPDRKRWAELTRPIEELGYALWRDNPAVDQQLYVKRLQEPAAQRTHHVHVRVPADAARELRFRDLLVADSELRIRYAELKRKLADLHRYDREAYTNGKTHFIEAALQRFGD
jgi:GrpB-like predicted nucleotidyltransferase (UPF0157 family)